MTEGIGQSIFSIQDWPFPTIRIIFASVIPGSLILIGLIWFFIRKKFGSDYCSTTGCYKCISNMEFPIGKNTWILTLLIWSIINYICLSLLIGLPYWFTFQYNDITHSGMWHACQDTLCTDSMQIYHLSSLFNLVWLWIVRGMLLFSVFLSIFIILINILLYKDVFTYSFRWFTFSSVLTLIQFFFLFFGFFFYFAWFLELNQMVILFLGPMFWFTVAFTTIDLFHVFIIFLPSVRSIMSFVSEEEANRFQRQTTGTDPRKELPPEVDAEEVELQDPNNNTPFAKLYGESYAHVLQKPPTEMSANDNNDSFDHESAPPIEFYDDQREATQSVQSEYRFSVS